MKEIKQVWNQKIHFKFVSFVFFIMLAAFAIISLLMLFAFHFKLINNHSLSPLFFVGLICLASLIIGTILSALTGKTAFSPILKLSEATKEVANGNFDVRIEHHFHGELGDFINNFNKMVQALRSTEILRNDFIVNVSHEFKTPIAAIQGYATLLQDDTLTHEERYEYTQMLLESTRRLSNLSSNILKLSKLETQDIVLDKERFSLDEQIRQALLFLEPQWTEKDIQLNIELEPAFYVANEELLMQVWLNIIGNAIKFSHEGQIVSVCLGNYRNCLLVTIQDDGIGMDKETQDHIFEKFYQGDASHSSEGNGLGLPLAKRIIDLCGGKIEVESELGKGATFTVTLPKEG